MKIIIGLTSVIAILLVALAGPLYKFGVVELGTAFTGFKFGLLAGIAALVLLAIQLLFKRNTASIGSADTVSSPQRIHAIPAFDKSWGWYPLAQKSKNDFCAFFIVR